MNVENGSIENQDCTLAPPLMICSIQHWILTWVCARTPPLPPIALEEGSLLARAYCLYSLPSATAALTRVPCGLITPFYHKSIGEEKMLSWKIPN